MNDKLSAIFIAISVALAINASASEIKISAGDGDSLNTFAVSLAMSGDDLFVGAPGNCDDSGNQGAVYFYHFSSDSSAWFERTKIEAVDAQPFDMFGRSVALSGDLAVIAARSNCLLTPNSGVVYIFQRLYNDWQQMTRLTSSSPYAGDDYGCSVAITDSYAVVGAPLGGFGLAGKIYIYKRTGDSWNLDSEVMADDSQMLDYFGFSVALSDSTILVGAPHADLSSINPKGGGTGAAYILDRVDGNWQQTAKLTPADATANNQFGCAVALDGRRSVIGARKDDVLDFDTGSAYIYLKDSTSGWQEEAKLTAVDADSGDVFGSSVALFDKYLVVGAPGVDGLDKNTGAVYSYLLTAEGWTQKSKTHAGDAAKNDGFGTSTAVSTRATAVGAPYKTVGQNSRQGAAYIYDNIQDLALPVQLSEFQASESNGVVLLEWRTESELDNLGFIIQRKRFGEAWEIIASFQDNGDLAGRGTATSAADYSFIDDDVSTGRYYYRLADVNINGDVTYHSVTSIAVSSAGANGQLLAVDSVMLYPAFPNPFNPSTTLNYYLPNSAFVNIAVYDIAGRMTTTLLSDIKQAGLHQIQWNGVNDKGKVLAGGVYFIHFRSGKIQQTQKVYFIR